MKNMVNEKKVLNILWPESAYREKNNYYIIRPWFFNQIAKHYKIKIFCKISSHKEELHPDTKLKEEIDCIDFFERLSFKHFLLHLFQYRRKVKSILNDRELFMVLYPFKKISVVLAWFLRKSKLIVWVRSNYITQFNICDKKIPFIFKTATKPGIAFIYNNYSKLVFKNNLVFYTGHIVIDKNNNLNQHAITECSAFNDNIDLISKCIKKKIVFVGDESKRKGLIYIIEALKKLSFSLSLTVIGVDALEKYKLAAKGLDIKCAGAIHDRTLYYKILGDSDILILPSIAEQQGRVQLEAMSAGVVPVCADTGGVFSTVENYHNGLLFRKKSSDDLKEKLELLYGKEMLYKKLQQNGLKYMESCNIGNQCEKMSGIINNFFE